MNLTLIAGSFGDAIKNWFQGWFGALFSFIPKIIYQLLTPLWAILDAMQWIMRKLAGLDTIAGFEGSKDFSGDLVSYFINAIFSGDSPVLSNIFWSMIILGALMLIITTFIAIIKSEYTATDAKSASKGKIVVSAFKAIASFAIVPIVCFFGIFLCNVILQAVDKISTAPNVISEDYSSKFKANQTSTGEETYYNYTFFGYKVPTNNTPISGIVFRTAAFNANRARTNGTFYQVMMDNEKVNAGGAFSIKNGTDDASKQFNTNIIDEAFANCYQVSTTQKIDREPFKDDHMFPLTLSSGVVGAENILINEGYQYFDKNNVALVWYYYDLWSFDILIAVGALVVIFTSFLNIIIGLIKRIFELVLLFLISAPMASLMPLDGGNALKKWRERFVSKAIGVYGPVLGMNLFFIILSILQSLNLTGIDIIDRFVYLLFVVAGLAMVKDFTAMISELVGGEDTLKAGGDKAKDVGATAKNIGTRTMALAGAAGKGIKLMSGASKAVGLTKVGKSAAKTINKNKAKKGEGRYAKGSQAYNNAVQNIGDNIDLSDGGVEALASTKDYGKNKFMEMSEHMTSDQWKTMISGHGFGDKLENNEENRQKVWNSINDETKQNFTKAQAEAELDGLSKKDRRDKIAKAQLDSMDWQDRQGVIDANNRSAEKQNKIRHRAIQAAGGLQEYRKLSSKDRAELFEQSKGATYAKAKTSEVAGKAANFVGNALSGQGFTTKTSAKTTINGEKIELGKQASEALGKAFKEYGKQCGSFVQHMLDGLSGGLGEGLKGSTDSMIGAFQGKLKKEIGVAEEKKNQKKILSAQRKAQQELDAGPGGAARREAEPKVSKKAEKQQVELSATTLKDFEKAVRNANEASANKTAQTMGQLKSSIDKLADALNKDNKKS